MAEIPSVYFHFEMGVQWRPRTSDSQGSSKNHQLSYMSRSARQRAHQFPRQLPPSNTNYLSTLPHPQYQYPYQWQYYQNDPAVFGPVSGHQSYPVTQPTAVTQPPLATHLQPQYTQASRSNRPCRSESRSSHGRGRSAPPPLSENSWDAAPEPMAATALPKRNITKPQIWKALPPTPGQFRLGHDDMPWTPPPYAAQGSEDCSQDSQLISPESSAGQVSHASHRSPEDCDKVRTKEMQSLATAMMTVDNGFEDQWWYQGPRLVNVAGDLMPPAACAENYHANARVTFPGAGELVSAHAADSPAGTMADIVSPVSDFSSSGSSFILRRSPTTRSEELHMYG